MLYPVLQDPLHQIVSSLFDRPRGASIGQMLFGAGEQGAWYDVADLSTLFQNSAGTVPVTAVEQPVGRILDKSGRGNHATQATTTKRPVLSRRVNLLTNTGFVGHTVGSPGNPPTGWVSVNATGQIIAAPAGVRVSVSGTRRSFRQTVALSQGTTIVAKASVEVHSGNLPVSTLLANIQGHLGDTKYFLNNIEVPSGTTVSAGVNDVVMTAVVSTAGGSVSIDFGAGVQSNTTGDVTIFNASLTRATDAHLPYQWVNTDTDYDADPSKFPAYLRFDGVDDALQTGNINFTGTDKMTVWAGVTKLGDASTGAAVELSASKNANNGVFALFAPLTPGSADISWYSKGTTEREASSTSESAPITRVTTGIGDIPGGISRLRVNGAVVQTNTSGQGPGNFGNYPLYIGARANTSYYFNGRLYSLIVRGAQSSLSQIEATEAYIKQKMRLP